LAIETDTTGVSDVSLMPTKAFKEAAQRTLADLSRERTRSPCVLTRDNAVRRTKKTTVANVEEVKVSKRTSIDYLKWLKSVRGHYRGLGKGTMNRWVFKHFLKTVSDGANVTFCGRVFHSRESATGKARSPIVERRVCRTNSDDDDAERKCWRENCGCTSRSWYTGPSVYDISVSSSGVVCLSVLYTFHLTFNVKIYKTKLNLP